MSPPNLFNPYRFAAGVNPANWEELANVELGSGSQTMDSGVFTAKENLMILAYVRGTSSSDIEMQLGNSVLDTASNYAMRRSKNFASDTTNASTDNIRIVDSSGASDSLTIIFIRNDASSEKLMIWNEVQQVGTGAATAPQQYEGVGKWVDTTNQCDIIGLTSEAGGSVMDTGTNLVVLGYNDGDVTEAGFWGELASDTLSGNQTSVNQTISPKRFLWVTARHIQTVADGSIYFQFNNDTASSYGNRWQLNYASNGTNTSDSEFEIGERTAPTYSSGGGNQVNGWIVGESGSEKLYVGVSNSTTNDAASGDNTTMTVTGKYADTSADLTTVNWINDGDAGSAFGTGSEFRVWGGG